MAARGNSWLRAGDLRANDLGSYVALGNLRDPRAGTSGVLGQLVGITAALAGDQRRVRLHLAVLDNVIEVAVDHDCRVRHFPGSVTAE